MPPINGGPHCRLSSPSGGGSTLITSAPMSARSIVQTGPDKIRERSTTNKSSSGFMYFWLSPPENASQGYQVSGQKWGQREPNSGSETGRNPLPPSAALPLQKGEISSTDSAGLKCPPLGGGQ